MEDLKRKLIELNISAARKRQSAQTGLVHHCYESQVTSEHDTIPILENTNFILALFRSRLVENILEAKALLEKILAFEIDGNFPVYLHDYPMCKDGNLSAHLLPALFWIGHDFQNVLGDVLKAKLEGALHRILERGLQHYRQGLVSKGAKAKILAYARELNWLEWNPGSPSEWADFLIALQMLEPFFGSLEEHLARAARYWHPQILAYVGANNRPFQEKSEPALTLYDMYMGYFFGSFSKRAVADHPVQLHAALIRPLPRHLQNSIWGQMAILPAVYHPNYGFNLEAKGGQPLTLLWGTAGQVHSLVCFDKKSLITARTLDDGCEMVCSWPEALVESEPDRSDVAFYCNIHAENSILINEARATAFRLDDRVRICSCGLQIELSFAKEGEGDFFGHLSQANRPMQISGRSENFQRAYDWQIGLRTLRRPGPASITIRLRICPTSDCRPPGP